MSAPDAPSLTPKRLEDLLRTVKVLIVDDQQNMRKVARALLIANGVRHIYEAESGAAGLQAICSIAPDVVILDWKMPGVDGAEFVRTVRSPGAFPMAHVPIIVLTGYGERSHVVEAMRLGANEFLLKPVSAKALHDRLVSVLTMPRPFERIGGNYIPKPRKSALVAPTAAADAEKLWLI